MNDVGLSASDWINIAIAVGVAATAVFTAITALAAKQQTRLYAPVINYTVSLRKGSLPPATFLLIPPDRERFIIAKLRIRRPRKARMIGTRAVRGPTGDFDYEPAGAPTRSLYFPPGSASVSAFVDAARAEEVTICAHITLRANSRVKSRFTIRISTKDW